MKKPDSVAVGAPNERSAASADPRLRFFEAISQEVRKPLDAMQALTDLLMRQPLTPDAEAYVRSLAEHHTSLLRTLDEACDLIRAESGQLTIAAEAIELRPLMDAIQDEWAPRALKSGVALSVAYDGADMAAMADAPRLRQIFNHLIGRAMAQTRRGGIEASLHARRRGEHLVVEGRVRDSGARLSDAQLKALFESEGGDEGMNMLLCSRLIGAMGGAIAAENNAGSGCTIKFEFTCDEAHFEEDDGLDPAAVRAAHVLVVDDNATNRMVAEALCEMFSCTSETAEDGIEALEAARSGRFDLILMDIKMPRMDGIEATKAIRALAGAAGQVPIIALTANADPEDAQSYLACGMTSVVEKPIKPEALLAAMNACLPDGSGESGRAAA